jgi:putative FmdB family regulatory protein
MPIYEYHCKQCGAKFDRLVKFSTQLSEIECPKCGARKAEKAVSRLGVMGSSSSRSSGAPGGASSCGPFS